MTAVATLKRVGGWVLALLLWLWATVPKALDWVGRSTLPDDWRQLMAEKLPAMAAWLFSTPWWVPAVFAAGLTAWMMWITRPQPSALGRVADDRTAKPPAALESTEEATPASVAPPFDPSGLYVGLMQVDAQHVSTRGVIEVTALCFNATGHAIDVQRVNGAVRVFERKSGNRMDLGLLPRAWFNSERSPAQNIGDLADFMVILEQAVPPAIASIFPKVGGDQTLQLMFEELEVVVSSHETPQIGARLPLWGGINVCRDGDWLQSRRVVTGRLKPITLSLSQGGN